MILKSSDEVECECSQNASEMVDKKGRKGERRLRNTAAIPMCTADEGDSFVLY